MSVSISISVVLLVGLPGSGKSTLARWLVHTLDASSSSFISSSLFDKVVWIEYDAIMENLLCEDPSTCTRPESKTPIHFKHEGPKDRPYHVHHSPRTDADLNEFTLVHVEAWKKARVQAMEQMKQVMNQVLQNASEDIRSSPLYGEDSSMTSTKMEGSCYKIMILMDDNFHLRSMRRNVYQECIAFLDERKQQQTQTQPLYISFATLHLDVPLSTCYIRNNQRIGRRRIPKHVIEQMHASMDSEKNTRKKDDIPTTRRNYFERYCLILGPEELSAFLLVMKSDRHSTIHVDTSSLSLQIQNKIRTFLEKSQKDPITPMIDFSQNPTTMEKKRQDQQRTLHSKIHQSDLLLRYLVGILCREEATFSTLANDARKLILHQIQQQQQDDTTKKIDREENTNPSSFTLEFNHEDILERFVDLTITRHLSNVVDLNTRRPLYHEYLCKSLKEALLKYMGDT